MAPGWSNKLGEVRMDSSVEKSTVDPSKGTHTHTHTHVQSISMTPWVSNAEGETSDGREYTQVLGF